MLLKEAKNTLGEKAFNEFKRRGAIPIFSESRVFDIIDMGIDPTTLTTLKKLAPEKNDGNKSDDLSAKVTSQKPSEAEVALTSSGIRISFVDVDHI